MKKGMLCTKMSTDWIGMKYNKDDIKKRLWYQLEFVVPIMTFHGVLEYEKAIIDDDKGFTQWCSKRKMNLLELFLTN